MGLLSWLGFGTSKTQAAMTAASPVVSSRTGVLSPWSEGELNKFVYSDIFGTDVLPVTRKEAMSVPAYAKARNTIVGLLAQRPLRQLDQSGVIKDQPTWLYRTDSDVPPWHRMACILDDHIWYGHSLLVVERGAGKQIIDAMRVPMDRWRVSPDGVIELRVGTTEEFTAADEDRVIYIPGPFEGLLNIAAENIRGAKALEAAWVDRASNPIATTVLHVQDDEMTQDELDDWLTEWRRLRKQRGGAVGSLPPNINMETYGDVNVELFTEGRNFARLDAAAFTNLTGVALDASLSESSLTYTTTEGKVVELHERLPFWTAPIEGRLSMDDVCPRGHRIRFDFSDDPTAQTTETGPFTED